MVWKSRPWSNIAVVTALTVGFWSQVFLWHRRLHPSPAPTAVEQQAALMQAPRPLPARPRAWPHRGYEIVGEPESPRRRRPHVELEVTEGNVRAVVDGLKGRLDPALFPPDGRVVVRAEVGADGRVGRMNIIATPELDPRAQRRLQRAIKRLQFPTNETDYATEFPLIFAQR